MINHCISYFMRTQNVKSVAISPFKKLKFEEDSSVQELIEQLTHMVSRDLTPLQRGVHTHPHKHIEHGRLL